MIKAELSNEILKYITDIERNRYKISDMRFSPEVAGRLRKNSKKKSSYCSNKIEGNPLSESQADEVIEKDERRHYLKPEQEIRNYFAALDFLEEKAAAGESISQELILNVQKLVVKGASAAKTGLRGPMPPGVLFAVYDTVSGHPEYIPPEYTDIPDLLGELIEYIITTDDHPLIVAAIVHYQLVTIHPFEDGNGRTARLISGYILDINGFGFNGIGSLEEYFAYDINEYYDSIQMGLPALYYLGRNNPPHSEIWILYFLRMVKLYSDKICQLSVSSVAESIAGSLSYLKNREKELLLLMLREHRAEYTPAELSRELGVNNKTVINRLAVLVRNGFAVPVPFRERIRSYKLSRFAMDNAGAITDAVSGQVSAGEVLNAVTRKAVKDAENGIGMSRAFSSVQELMEDLNADN